MIGGWASNNKFSLMELCVLLRLKWFPEVAMGLSIIAY
jgi:NADH:ubiquinone oxidoreductase subunit H